MLPFLLPLGKDELCLQYGWVNHNKIGPSSTLKIVNNLSNNIMEAESTGHDAVMDKDFELIFYQSNEVR